jgi:hypothetical protein
MRWSGIGRAAALVWLAATVMGAQVQVHLFCLSLRLAPATAQKSGLDYTASVGDDPTASNGELGPAPNGTPSSYGGFLSWTDPTTHNQVTLPFVVDVPPPADTNQNGVDDFFEAALAVPVTVTAGSYQTPDNRGHGFTATWSRPASSKDGLCVLNLVDLGLVFQHPFEVIEYDGSLDYTNAAGPFTGWVELQQFQNPTNTLAGEATLLLNGPDRLDLADGAWADAAGTTMPFGIPTPLTRTGTNYLALFAFADGDPSTPQADYTDWTLLLCDAHDYNGDGVPDLSDPLPPPQLTLSLDDQGLGLQLQGVVGQSYRLEQLSDLNEDEWSPVQTLTLTHATQTIPLGSPAPGAQFYRVELLSAP